MSIVAVLLAADAGAGFTPTKYLADVAGSTLLGRAIASASSWPVDETVVVLGADHQLVEDRSDLASTTVVVDPGWKEGLASPLRAVLDFTSRDGSITHVVIGFGDQMDVRTADVDTLVSTALDRRSDVVVPKYRYATGYPVIIRRPLWDVFVRLEGDIDIHDVIATHTTSVDEVWFDHVAPRRILGPEDLPPGRR